MNRRSSKPRPPRRLPVDPHSGGELFARAVFEPGGMQVLEIDRRYGVPFYFTADQIPWLRKALAEFEREATFEDGRPDTRHNRHIKPLMTGTRGGEISS